MMNVCVILNTTSHVEVAISLYFSLDRIPGLHPVLWPILGNHWNLFGLLDELGVRYQPESRINPADFGHAIVVTAYPIESGQPHLAFHDHPIVEAFKGRRILITHRGNRSWHYYRGEKVLSLVPFSERRGIPFFHLCEHPFLRSPPPTGDLVRFLVQGRFGYRHRNLSLLDRILDEFPDGYEIVLLGSGSDKLGYHDPRVSLHQNLKETDFYRTAAECAFVMPLIDDGIRRGTYVHERFSSSLLFTLSGPRPALLHRSLEPVYPLATACFYGDEREFITGFKSLLHLDGESRRRMAASSAERLERMRRHNAIVLKNMILT